MRPAVFLDRDGTLNRCYPSSDGATTRPPQSLEELDLMAGAAAACARLRAGGFALLVVTNQPDVRRGTQSRDVVEAMNRRIVADLGLDGVATCYHDDRDGCSCRKPRPGLLLRLAEAHGVDLPGSWLVGDRASDVAAGRAAGCRTVLISAGVAPGSDHVVPTVGAAAELILANHATPGAAHVP